VRDLGVRLRQLLGRAEMLDIRDGTRGVAFSSSGRACSSTGDVPRMACAASCISVSSPESPAWYRTASCSRHGALSRAPVAHALKLDDLVVYESTVYPGATEEDCIPVLSGLKAGIDFNVVMRRRGISGFFVAGYCAVTAAM
jgi:hypothetical protein